METQKPSHITPDGSLVMVDVAHKAVTLRAAKAQAIVAMSPATGELLAGAVTAKGDAFVAAQLAGIMAAKKTGELIPLAHPLPLSSVEVSFTWAAPGRLQIDATARTSAQTGVELEAMVAATIAALTIYDMIKAVEKGVRVESVRLLEKSGGKSGRWQAAP